MDKLINKSIKEIYAFPLFTDKYGVYIFDQNHKVCFNWYTDDESIQDRIIKLINDEDGEKFDNVTYDLDFIYINKKPILFVRGWGYLTGIGGLHLSTKEATNIQKEMIEYVVNKIYIS